MKEEFDVLGMPFDHRGAAPTSSSSSSSSVFTEAAPIDGRFYACPRSASSPAPEQQVPVWVGGDTEAAFRRTARFGDAFHAAFQTVADVDAAWKRIRSCATRPGATAPSYGCRCGCTSTRASR